MPSTKKIERVAELKEQIEGSAALLLTEYRGLTVSEITELRKSLREGGASFSVIKNTLMRRALEQTDAAELGSLFDGPSAVAFVQEDPVAAAKSVTTAAKRFPALVLKGGFVEGRLLDAEEAKSLADLESREVMLSKLAGLMKGEMSRAAARARTARAFATPGRRLGRCPSGITRSRAPAVCGSPRIAGSPQRKGWTRVSPTTSEPVPGPLGAWPGRSVRSAPSSTRRRAT